jgi:hypothetical protein
MPDDVMSKLGLLDQNFLWASCLWGAVATGYCVYGWKQRSLIPFLGGLVMTAMSFLGPNALVMSLVCVAAVFAVWWLTKQGY